MWGLTRKHWRAVSEELASPSPYHGPDYQWQPSENFGPLPSSLTAAYWTPQEFAARSFPAAPLPTKPVITINTAGWDQLVSRLIQSKLITTGQLQHLKIVRSWLAHGCPPYVSGPGTSHTMGTHHIEDHEVAMALESIAAFIRAGHMAGPFLLTDLPYRPAQLKYIGLFGKQKPHGGSLRLIKYNQPLPPQSSSTSLPFSDHSSPRGRSFNDGIPDSVINEIKLHMGELHTIIDTILRAGRGAMMSKHDLSEAFQILGVHPSQYPLQAINIFGSIFIAVKMTYGDSEYLTHITHPQTLYNPFTEQACHRFSRTHEVILRHLVLPQCSLPRHQLEMVVDDVIAISSPDQPADTLHSFDQAYTSTMATIGLKTKKHDPSGFKAFRNLTRGEILGFVVDTPTLTWNLGEEKRAKIIQAIEECYDMNHLHRPVYITLKTAQRAFGKLNALAACWRTAKPWLLFITKDISRYVITNPDANTTPKQYQPRDFAFCPQARNDLHLLRAILVTQKDNWIPLTDPYRSPPSVFDLCIFTDASGQVNLSPTDLPPALGVVIPTHPTVEGRVAAFPLPMSFLLAQDDKTYNYFNSMLLECLAILTAIVRWPKIFRRKTVLATTDNISLVYIYRSCRPHGIYMSHLIRTLFIVTDRIQCELHLTWLPRRSHEYDELADNLTHQNFATTPDDITHRTVEQLPPPILDTLVNSVNFSEHQFGQLWPRIIEYWKTKP